MVDTCCVEGCTKPRKKESTRSYFTIPKDPIRRAAWLKALPNPPRTNRCCERHFQKNFILYEDELGNKRKYKKLSSDAVPTIFKDYDKHIPVRLAHRLEDRRRQAVKVKRQESMDVDTVNEVVIDKVGTFDDLQNGIQVHINLMMFQVQICETEIYLFDLNVTDSKRLTIRTSVVISDQLEVVIHFNGIRQKVKDLPGIFGVNFKLVLYSQLQKLIDKYSNAPPNVTPITIGDHEPPLAETQATDNNLDNEKQIEITRQTVIDSIEKFQLAINKNPSYRHELDFVIDQIRLTLPHVSQFKFTMESILYALLMYSHVGVDNYEVIRGQFRLTLPLTSTMHLLTTLDDSPPPIPGSHRSGYFTGIMAKLAPHKKLVNLQIKQVYYNGRLSIKATNANCQAKSVLCFLINSIFGDWKRVVYFLPVNEIVAGDLCDITLNVIGKIHRLKLQVLSVTAEQNLATKNMFQQMMSSGDMADENLANGRFGNAAHPGEHIYLLYNPASIMQNIRNEWIDQADEQKSLSYPNFDNGTLSTACFRHLHELYESELEMLIRTATKLEHETVYPNANERELFTLTLNIFDMSTIVGLRTASRGYGGTVDFLNLINMWWNIMDIRLAKHRMQTILDENLTLLPSLIVWAEKWQTMLNESGGDQSGRLSNETLTALIQTTKVMLALAKLTLSDRQIRSGFRPGRFHTDNFQLLFSKYKKYRKV